MAATTARRCCGPLGHGLPQAQDDTRGICANRLRGMSVPPHLQIAIDGPAASGKTTVAHRLAQRLSILYLDTGALYRALAYLALHTRTEADNESALVRLWESASIRVVPESGAPLGFRVYARGEELGEKVLQSNEVTAVVSTVAAHPLVRETMLHSQRRIAQEGPVVMAGRDIGTVVLPLAHVKIFLTASVTARVERRRLQLEAAGVAVDARALAQEIQERDRLDRERTVSPLVPAADAHVIDSSAMGAAEVVDEIAAIVERAR
jgi:cytidylate kinase